MNRKDFDKLVANTFNEIHSLNRTKGDEYSRGSYDTNSNFARLAKDLGHTKEEILWVYLAKHIDAIVCHIKDRANNVERLYSEPIEGRIHDAINYLLLLKAMLVEEKDYARSVSDNLGNDKKGMASIADITWPDANFGNRLSNWVQQREANMAASRYGGNAGEAETGREPKSNGEGSCCSNSGVEC